MAFDTVPWIIDGTTIDGEVIRRALGTLINPAGGVVTPGDLAVSAQSVPNMSVQIGVGQIWVPGSSTPSQGLYYGRNGAAVTVAISASNSANPRIDTIIAQVQDAAYAGAIKQLQPAVVIGTPTSGATLANLTGQGAVPASSLVLAYVLVPAAATSITTGDILNVQSTASSGLPQLQTIVATTTTAAVAGQSILALNGLIVTLPAAGRNAVVEVFAFGVSGPSPVEIETTAGAAIIGEGVNAATMYLGTQGACVRLRADGSNWEIVAGQQDTGWVAVTPGTDFSATPAGAYPATAKLAGDRVWLRGGLQYSGTSTSLIQVGTVPAGMAPAQTIGCGTVWAESGGYCDVGQAGQTFVSGPMSINSSRAIWYAPNVMSATHTLLLDNISYPVS